MWKMIEGYDYPYKISDEGEVQSKARGKWVTLKPKIKNRLAYVCMRKGGKCRAVLISALMADAFMGGRKQGYVIRHLDGARLNCSLQNLSQVERREFYKTLGGSSRKSVEKVDRNGNVVGLYASIAEAAKAEFCSCNSVKMRCHGEVKNPFDLTGYTYRFEG